MMNFWPIGVDLIFDKERIRATTSQNLMGETVEVIGHEIYQHYYLSRFTSWPYHIQKLIDERSIPRSASYIIMLEGGYGGYRQEMPANYRPDFLKFLGDYHVYSLDNGKYFRASLLQRWA